MNFLVFAVLLIGSIYCKITFENGLEATQITLKDVHSFSQVLVQAQFNYVDNQRYEKVHLVVRSSNKHKKQAYIDLMKKYNGVVKALIKLKAIPNKESMIHSIIHRNFLRKSRKWQFSRYFILYALRDQIPNIIQRLHMYKPQQVKTAPVVHYLDQKFMSIAAFIQAKLELQKFIKQHLNSEYKILQTKDIEIIGDKIVNQQIIQDDIEHEFNKGTEIGKTTQPKSGLSDTVQERGYYSDSHKNGRRLNKIIMKVLFQLVEKAADVQDILQGIEGEEQSISISDFENQIENQNWKEEDKSNANVNDAQQEQDQEEL